MFGLARTKTLPVEGFVVVSKNGKRWLNLRYCDSMTDAHPPFIYKRRQDAKAAATKWGQGAKVLPARVTLDLSAEPEKRVTMPCRWLGSKRATLPNDGLGWREKATT